MKQWRSQWQRLTVLAIAILLIIVFNSSVGSQPDSELPEPRVHPLPQFLKDWQEPSNSGNYFKQIEATPLGYLVWTQFPVKVYVESTNAENSAASKRFQQWTATVRQAIAEWNTHVPLLEVKQPDTADIVVWRSQPEREVKLDPDTGLYDIPRAVTAQTNFKFYLTEESMAIALRMTVRVSPNYVGESLLATVRHELGHALGIWGHSPEATDALYFSQVSDPPPISPRDINTLKKIYQQPTRLGWKI